MSKQNKYLVLGVLLGVAVVCVAKRYSTRVS